MPVVYNEWGWNDQRLDTNFISIKGVKLSAKFRQNNDDCQENLRWQMSLYEPGLIGK